MFGIIDLSILAGGLADFQFVRDTISSKMSDLAQKEPARSMQARIVRSVARSQ